MTTVPDSIKSLLSKIKALAERGIDGERDAAAAKLQQLCTAYKLDITDLADIEKRRCVFSLKSKADRRLLLQILFWRLNASTLTVHGKRRLWIELTKAEEADVRHAFAYYREALRKDQELFWLGFVFKHHLYGPGSDSNEENPMSLEDIQRIVALMGGMKSQSWRRVKGALAQGRAQAPC